MISNKKLLITSAITGLAGVGIITSSVIAATGTSTPSYPPLVQKIADTFHLNPSDVQKVFDQNKQDRQAQHEQKLKDHLDQLVKNGTITQDQEDKIIAKLKDLKQNLKSENRQNRTQNRDDFRAQIQQWLTDNGINVNLDQLLPPHPQHDGQAMDNSRDQ
jgi:polyhydroxyalkanoate synthesis regulator phasin